MNKNNVRYGLSSVNSGFKMKIDFLNFAEKFGPTNCYSYQLEYTHTLILHTNKRFQRRMTFGEIK